MLLSVTEPHRDFERAVRDIFSPESHVDDVGSRLGRGVENVEGTVLVLDDFRIHFGPVGCDDDARDLALSCAFCVHHEAHLFSNADGRPDARTCKIKTRRLDCAEEK